MTDRQKEQGRRLSKIRKGGKKNNEKAIFNHINYLSFNVQYGLK
jgi:hypothetical protein